MENNGSRRASVVSINSSSNVEDTEKLLQQAQWRKIMQTYSVAFLACFSNGIVYSYSLYSTRLINTVQGLTPSDVVIMGVLSHFGLGLQYPTALLFTAIEKNNWLSMRASEIVLNLLCGLLFLLPMCGIGAVLYVSENGAIPSPSVSMPILSLCFLFWGQAAGVTFNACSAVVNYNTVGYPAIKRPLLVLLSVAISLSGVLYVVMYEYSVKDAAPLSTLFFGTAIFYFVTIVIRVLWMKRVNLLPPPKISPVKSSNAIHDNDETMEAEGNNQDNQVKSEEKEQSMPESQSTLPLCTVLKDEIVLLTFVGAFLGIGVSGTLLSSIGNIGPTIEDNEDYTFSLTLTFLGMQAVGRLLNAFIYSYGNWPYVFAMYQMLCLLGVVVLLCTSAKNVSAAFAGICLVGISFGGFHSCFSVLALAFPGTARDYANNLGLTLLTSSVGAIVVGQITSAVFRDTFEEHGFVRVFILFVVLAVISSVSALILGWRVTTKRKQKQRADA